MYSRRLRRSAREARASSTPRASRSRSRRPTPASTASPIPRRVSLRAALAHSHSGEARPSHHALRPRFRGQPHPRRAQISPTRPTSSCGAPVSRRPRSRPRAAAFSTPSRRKASRSPTFARVLDFSADRTRGARALRHQRRRTRLRRRHRRARSQADQPVAHLAARELRALPARLGASTSASPTARATCARAKSASPRSAHFRAFRSRSRIRRCPQAQDGHRRGPGARPAVPRSAARLFDGRRLSRHARIRPPQPRRAGDSAHAPRAARLPARRFIFDEQVRRELRRRSRRLRAARAAQHALVAFPEVGPRPAHSPRARRHRRARQRARLRAQQGRGGRHASPTARCAASTRSSAARSSATTSTSSAGSTVDAYFERSIRPRTPISSRLLRVPDGLTFALRRASRSPGIVATTRSARPGERSSSRASSTCTPTAGGRSPMLVDHPDGPSRELPERLLALHRDARRLRAPHAGRAWPSR